LQDPLFRPALQAFFEQQKQEHTELLLRAVRQSIRDTMKEARLAGKVEAYEDSLRDLERFAQEQIRSAKGE
jgi:hypothetical protein